MKTKTIKYSAISAFLLLAVIIFSGPLTGSDYIMLENFDSYRSTPFSQWKFRGKYSHAQAVYSIRKEGYRKFLHAGTGARSKSVWLGKLVNENNIIGKNKTSWDIKKYPMLSWDWRVQSIPEKGNERIRKKNDSAAGIYVIFQIKQVPFVGWQNQPAHWIKYVWSTTLPVGTVVERKSSKLGVSIFEGRYVVVASGKKGFNRWRTFRRNVLKDYIRFFGKTPKFNPIAIGILTDSNSTDSVSSADYDNIKAGSD